VAVRPAIAQASSVLANNVQSVPSNTSPLRVLLVEDSKVLSQRLTEVLREISGVTLVGIADTEAAAVAFVGRESVDVIILDLMLRVGTGIGVMRALAATHLKPRIIVLTNHDLAEYRRAALALGAVHFLDKARDFDLLANLLQEISRADHLKR
jgi:DNA-binding NarL/FixJ family response regulator